MKNKIEALKAQGIKITGAKEQIYTKATTESDKAFLINEGWEYIDDGLQDIFEEEMWERHVEMR